MVRMEKGYLTSYIFVGKKPQSITSRKEINVESRNSGLHSSPLRSKAAQNREQGAWEAGLWNWADLQHRLGVHHLVKALTTALN